MSEFKNVSAQYFDKLQASLSKIPLDNVETLADEIQSVWEKGRQLFIFGNGGSAGNASHLANDYLYGIGGGEIPGLKVHALPSNSSVITCLANDEGYEKIFV